jgi:serine/threonine protein kinase
MNCQIVNLRPVGLGSNGDVYVGQRTDKGVNVVVKYLREAHLPHARRAFAREVRILERRLHGLVPLLFANMIAKRPYYVMPYLEGGTLTQFAGRLTDIQLHAVATELACTRWRESTLHLRHTATSNPTTSW